jgi:hypothetical protein
MLVKAHETVDHAIKSYQANERSAAQAFQRVGGEIV